MSDPTVTIITPTGDRPQSFAMLERFVARQTYTGRIQWIVVDDGRVETSPETFAENPAYEAKWLTWIRREPRADDPKHTLGVNLLAALPHVEGDYVFFYEDDDRKAPGHIEHYVRLLADHDLVGEARARYYHLPSRRYKRHRNAQHASLSDTAMRASLLPKLKRIIEADPADWFIDLKLWKLDVRRHVFTDVDDAMVLNTSLKGMPGRRSPVTGHRRTAESGQHDPDLSQLRQWTGEDFELYEPLARPPRRVAIVSQGGTASQYPGPEGYEAVIGVNIRATQHRCTHWAFSDIGPWNNYRGDVIGEPIVCTRTTKIRHFERDEGEAGEAFRALPAERLINQDELGLPRIATGGGLWNKCSGPGALGVAWSLKPDRIDCYGCDMGGETDAPGTARTPDRWQRERGIWRQMVDMMAAEGIEVHHAQPGGGMVDAQAFLADDDPDPPGDRRWVWKNPYGWTTQPFHAPTAAAFRELLAHTIGPDRAQQVEIREVV